jgi:anaerobic magnesium-protoporphyrin IX monomethyl ester cyclase
MPMSFENFKVMFINVNDRFRTFIPINISYLSASLKRAGFATCLFDTSFYAEQEGVELEKKKEDAGIFMPVDYESIGVHLKEDDLFKDFLRAVENEKPQLIAFSIFSQAKSQNFDMANAVKEKFPDIPVVMGGIHVNVEPEEVFEFSSADYLCLGEGEEALVELAEYLAEGKDVANIRNLVIKTNGGIQKNPLRPAPHMDELPFPDWELFKPYHQYGPFRGRLYKMALVEYSRTCPFDCHYCGNDALRANYRDSGQLKGTGYRMKSPRRWIDELKFLKDNYGLELVYIVDGTFAAQKSSNLEEIAELYTKEIGLPFFCDATVFCLSPKKAKLLKDMGCMCVNMGVESGNLEYRKKYLNRTMTNDQIITSFLEAREAGLETRSFNIIGSPYETREDIMGTIELNRKSKVGSISLSIFMPYEGTALRKMCIDDGLLDPDMPIAGDGTEPIIKNPSLSYDELMGLYGTFALYVLAPRELWPDIKRAEANTPEGLLLRKEILKKIEGKRDFQYIDPG